MSYWLAGANLFLLGEEVKTALSYISHDIRINYGANGNERKKIGRIRIKQTGDIRQQMGRIRRASEVGMLAIMYIIRPPGLRSLQEYGISWEMSQCVQAKPSSSPSASSSKPSTNFLSLLGPRADDELCADPKTLNGYDGKWTGTVVLR